MFSFIAQKQIDQREYENKVDLYFELLIKCTCTKTTFTGCNFFFGAIKAKRKNDYCKYELRIRTHVLLLLQFTEQKKTLKTNTKTSSRAGIVICVRSSAPRPYSERNRFSLDSPFPRAFPCHAYNT